MSTPPGRSAAADGRQHLPRAEHVEDDPVDRLVGRVLGDVGRAAAPSWPAARRRTSRRCARRPRRGRRAARRRCTRPVGPTARSSEQVSAPDPAPASSTVAPGIDVAHRRRSGRRPSGRSTAAPRGIDSTKSASSGRSARYSVPAVEVHHAALGRADQGVVLDRAAVGVELLARLERDGVQPALGVGELHPLARAGTARTRVRSAHRASLRRLVRRSAAEGRRSARMPAGLHRPASTTRYSGPGWPARRRAVLARRVRRAGPGPVSSGRATSRTGSRAAVGRRRRRPRASSTIAARTVGAVDDDEAAGAAVPTAARSASATDRSRGHEQAGAQQRGRARAVGHAVAAARRPAATARRRTRGSRRAAAPTRPATDRRSRGSCRPAPMPTTSDRHGPAGPAATGCRSAATSGIAQTAARSSRPPSSGRPGSRLKTTTTRLLQASSSSSTPSTSRAAAGEVAEQRSAGEHERDERPAAAIRNSSRGAVGLASRSRRRRRAGRSPRAGPDGRSARLTAVWPSSWASTQQREQHRVAEREQVGRARRDAVGTASLDERAVDDGEQRRDDQPGRREVERHAEERPMREHPNGHDPGGRAGGSPLTLATVRGERGPVSGYGTAVADDRGADRDADDATTS